MEALGYSWPAQAFSHEPRVTVMVVVFGIIQTIVMLPVAALLARRKPAEPGEITQVLNEKTAASKGKTSHARSL